LLLLLLLGCRVAAAFAVCPFQCRGSISTSCNSCCTHQLVRHARSAAAAAAIDAARSTIQGPKLSDPSFVCNTTAAAAAAVGKALGCNMSAAMPQLPCHLLLLLLPRGTGL
jgi:hypothetical protein